MLLVQPITSCGSLHGVSGCRRTWQPAMPQRAAWRSATVSQSTAQQAPPPADEYREADMGAASEAFRHAYRQSANMPDGMGDGVAIDGMQQFAAAIWERQRHIPSQSRDPLSRIFDSFDTDGDGHLTANEVSAALRSRNVELTTEIAQKFIQASDADSNKTVGKSEFASLVLHMASADLRNKEVAEYWAKRECGIDCNDCPDESCDLRA